MANTEAAATMKEASVNVDRDSKFCVESTILWQDLYTEQFQVELHAIERKVQNPPEGTILKSDLLWELRQTRLVRRLQGGSRKDVVVAQQCFILTNRVADFIHGMENGNGGFTCKYVKIRTQPAREHDKFKVTETTPNEVTRYHCQYGPQDHTGNVKQITSLLLPKHRPKVLLASATNTKRQRKKKDALVHGDEQQDIAKKRRGRKKAANIDVDVQGDTGKKKRGRKKVALVDGDVQLEASKKTRGRKKNDLTDVTGSEVYKPKRTRKPKVTPHATHNDHSTITLEGSTLVPSLQATQHNTTEHMTCLGKPPCHCRSEHIEADVTSVPQLPTLDCNIADPNEKGKQSMQFNIDLNSLAVDVQAKEPCLRPCNASDHADVPSTTKKPRRNTRLVTCKRAQPKKRQAKTLPKAILEFDLNVLPLSSDIQATEEVKEDRTIEDTILLDSATATNNATEQNTMDNLNTAAPHSSADGGNGASANAAPKNSRDSKKQWGGSLKRGCLASFHTKSLYLLPHVTEICIFEGDHVNIAGLHCHGSEHAGDRSAFSWRLSSEIKEFVTKLLRDGHSVSQIMSKHIAVVKESLVNGEELTRDMFLHERDVRNLATKVARETYMLDSNDAKSVQLWVQENRDNVFYYRETGVRVQGQVTSSNMPFTIGIQTPWQREMMLQFGHESAVSIDATFGTNEKKFPLYTLMVFDDWHNGIPVAFILTSRSGQEDLTPWMTALDNAMKKERPHWKPNAFIVDCAQGEINSLRIVWPRTAIFLCLWHVHRAWQKQSCIKIRDSVLRAQILKGLGSIMYDRTGPSGDAATGWAIQKLQQLENTYPAENEFWDYVKGQWLPKVHMWVVGYRNLPYAGQDTNAAIESYYSYMKSVLKAERSQMTGRRVDWCIHVLTGDVLTHYWYQTVRKMCGFVDNRKEQSIVVSALILARNIEDTDVTLPEFIGGPAYVTSSTHRHVRYVVHNPGELWATCNCVHSQRGNTCKHKVKVLRLLHPEVAEGTVARFCAALRGAISTETSQCFTPARSASVMSMRTPHSVSMTSPSLSGMGFESPRPSVDLHSTLRMQAHDLLDFVMGNTTLMEHLHIDFNRSYGKLKTLAAEIESGKLHPARSLPVFHIVEDGLGMRLGRLKDMLERKSKPAASRMLRMGGNSPA